LHSISKLLAKYAAWLNKVLIPLGPWGVLIIATLDSVGFGIPIDPVVATFVYLNHRQAWLYVLVASAGSALGCMVLYFVGHKGGEALLEKRIPKAKFEKIKKSFEQHEFLALMLPAMLPPPTPYKLIVLSAAAFEMDWHRFLAAIFLGRVARFTILSILVIKYGRQVVDLMASLVRQHLLATGIAVAGLVVMVFLFRRLRSRRKNVAEASLGA